MRTPPSTLPILAAVFLLGGTAPVLAFPRYTEVRGEADTNCAQCHGDFRASPYTSLVDGQAWSDSLMNAHGRQGFLSGDCDTCHGPNRWPVLLNSSDGGTGFDPIACVGCHGRAEDEQPTNCADPPSAGPCGVGAGLRRHHFNANRTIDTPNGPVSTQICADCHMDADPANGITPVGENVFPPYYFTPDDAHPLKPTEPCNLSGEEDREAGPTGLDNDGDLAYDGTDDDCMVSAGSPGETSGDGLPMMLVTGHNPDPELREMTLTYGLNCGTTDNILLFGELFDVGSYNYLGQVCALGTSGNYTWSLYPDTVDSFFFLIVGTDDSTEGSYGQSLTYDATGTPVLNERSPDLINSTCGLLTQDLPNRCD